MKLFSDKFIQKINEEEITPEEVLGLSKNNLVYYPFITKKGFMNIKDVFVQTPEADKVLFDYYSPLINPGDTKQQIVVKVCKAVNDRVSYTTDLMNYKQSEYWARPIDVHNTKVDDCDGYAVLIVKVLRLLGFGSDEVFVRAGDVFDVNGKFAGGHANVMFFDKSRFEVYPLEGSFYAKKTLDEFTLRKIPLVIHPRYGDTWWFTNDVYSMSPSKMPFRFIR